MSERTGYEPGVPCWVSAVEPDPGPAVRFYTQLFGWQTDDLMPAGHPASYHMCRLRGSKVASIVSPHGGPTPPTAVWATHIWVDDADAVAAQVAESGGSVLGAPFDSPAGGRMAVLADPDGAVFSVWQPGEHRGAQRVNEPGAWAMSMLVATDPERAATFYSTIFSWTTETFGDTRVTLWRLPGYVGGEPQQPVSREVVAGMLPAGDGPSQWTVDFWVGDADVAAANAMQLGGRVIEPAHDTPGFRRAVLADPGGAVFSVSKLLTV